VANSFDGYTLTIKDLEAEKDELNKVRGE